MYNALQRNSQLFFLRVENSNPINKEAKSPILIFIAFYLIFPYKTRGVSKISRTPRKLVKPNPPSTSYQVTVAWSFQTATIESEQGTPTSLGGWGCAGFTRQGHRKKKILKGVSLEKIDGSFLLKASLTKKEQSLYKTKKWCLRRKPKMKHCIFQP